MIDLSVIIPTYNAKFRAHATVTTLHAKLAETGLASEIVLVDDGSRPGERPEAAALPPGVRVVQVDRNRGKGHAVRTGLAVATGRARIFTDVDLPYGVESLLECYEKLNRGDADFVYGDRSLPDSTIRSRLRKRRRLSSVVFRGAVFAIAGLRQADTQCGIKGLRGRVAAAMLPLLKIDGFAFDVEMFRCARDNHLTIAPIAVHLANGDDSTVRLVRDSTAMLRDLLAIRARSARGRYRLDTGELGAASAAHQA
jgi:dolichyl-phosphate beta-glucosyltransferase